MPRPPRPKNTQHETGKYSLSINEHFMKGVREWRRGNSGYIDSFFARDDVNQKLWAYANRMTKNHDEAAEFVQDTQIRAFKALETFKGAASVTTWLFRIMTNIMLDAYKKKTRAPPTEQLYGMVGPRGSSSHEESEMERNDIGVASFEDEVLDRAENEKMGKAILQLPEDQQTLIIGFHFDGMEYKEMADAAGLPLGTVKSRLNRARLALRDLVMKLEQDATRAGEEKTSRQVVVQETGIPRLNGPLSELSPDGLRRLARSFSAGELESLHPDVRAVVERIRKGIKFEDMSRISGIPAENVYAAAIAARHNKRIGKLQEEVVQGHYDNFAAHKNALFTPDQLRILEAFEATPNAASAQTARLGKLGLTPRGLQIQIFRVNKLLDYAGFPKGYLNVIRRKAESQQIREKLVEPGLLDPEKHALRYAIWTHFWEKGRTEQQVADKVGEKTEKVRNEIVALRKKLKKTD